MLWPLKFPMDSVAKRCEANDFDEGWLLNNLFASDDVCLLHKDEKVSFWSMKIVLVKSVKGSKFDSDGLLRICRPMTMYGWWSCEELLLVTENGVEKEREDTKFEDKPFKKNFWRIRLWQASISGAESWGIVFFSFWLLSFYKVGKDCVFGECQSTADRVDKIVLVSSGMALIRVPITNWMRMGC